MIKNYLLLFLFTAFYTSAQDVVIPNDTFRNTLLNINASTTTGVCFAKDANGIFMTIDANDDNIIQVSEALLVYELDIRETYVGLMINNITGIESFTNLRKLNLWGHNFPTFNPTIFTHLEYLDLNWCWLQNLDVSGMQHLQTLICFYNLLDTLTLNDLPSLQVLRCSGNHLTSINLSGCPNLTELNISGNNLPDQGLDVSGLTYLELLQCNNNNQTSLHLENLTALTKLECGQNPLTSLDLSSNPNLNILSVNNCPIEYLNLKNGSGLIDWQQFNISNVTTLQYVCIDEEEIAELQEVLTLYNLSSVNVNSYCSFVPGGEYSNITGSMYFDYNSNGCDNDDNEVLMKLLISNGTSQGQFISNTAGVYSIPVQEGTQTITPVNPNPAYYTVSPQEIAINVTAAASTIDQNFCLTALGTYNDLDVTILPVTPARPGFNAAYRIIYKNTGTTTLSGTIALSYLEDVLDFEYSDIVPQSENEGSLQFAFEDLRPFEDNYIFITFNVNSPIETPAVNINDVLDFTAAIAFEGADETPLNNIYTFNQTVVGSFDPNDKTCVEGTTITPDMVGGYVTYMIRFENTGTYMAENIVVKDMIDTTKFDVSTLMPLQSSHPYITRVTGNKAEFFFENIMLPGTPSEDRHGFVAFKIKTLPTLSLNDSFSNTAEIYFDYNAPIVTNEAETTVALPLSNPDFDFKNFIALYPNPTGNTLNLDVKESLSVKNIAVYNMLGQQLISIVNAGNKLAIDVAGLAAGSYIIKVGTDKGASAAKFIKE